MKFEEVAEKVASTATLALGRAGGSARTGIHLFVANDYGFELYSMTQSVFTK